MSKLLTDEIFALEDQLEAAKQRELELLAVIEKMRKDRLDTALDIFVKDSSQALREHEAKAMEEYRIDALRYRYLCECDTGNLHYWLYNTQGEIGKDLTSGIDAAMEEEQRKK